MRLRRHPFFQSPRFRKDVRKATGLFAHHFRKVARLAQGEFEKITRQIKRARIDALGFFAGVLNGWRRMGVGLVTGAEVRQHQVGKLHRRGKSGDLPGVADPYVISFLYYQFQRQDFVSARQSRGAFSPK